MSKDILLQECFKLLAVSNKKEGLIYRYIVKEWLIYNNFWPGKFICWFLGAMPSFVRSVITKHLIYC